MKRTAPAGLAVAILCASCVQAPPNPPAAVVPPSFESAPVTGASWPSEQWYRRFSSDELTSLVEAAAKDNLDLSEARARVAQADARARQAGAAILPNIDAVGNANYLAGHSSSSGSGHETDWSALLSASYEIDFWGKNRAVVNAAGYAAAASRAERDTVALTTLAGVADGYFEVLALRERLAIARSNLETARRLLAAVDARAAAGFASPMELATQQAALASAEMVIPDLQQRQAEAQAALALLVGRAPEGFEIQEQSLAGLHEPTVGAGLPSELLVRRPDIAVAERNLRSAQADMTAAHAALFPSISLTAQAGVQNPALNAAVLSLPGSGPTLNLGASVVQAVFNHGRLRAVQAEAEAKDQELLAAYRAAILAALRDVENALSALQHLNEQQVFKQENLTQSERAFEGARLRYEAGSGDFLMLLEAQRTLYAARDQQVQFRLARLQTLVGLCKALGGGWQESSRSVTAHEISGTLKQ
ncbi:MAG: efflux transporter outer membrane subunit [Steroidobacterales bacterium]